MIRTGNPLNTALASSTCRFEVFSPTPVKWKDSPLIEQAELRGGRFQFNENSSGIIMDISHEHCDATSGLYIFDSLNIVSECHSYEDNIICKLGSLGQTSYRHFCHAKVKTSKSEQSVSQRFVTNLLVEFPHLLEENIGIAVAIENTNLVNSRTLWGNSIAIVPIKGKILQSLSIGPRKDWREFLVRRALRIISLGKRVCNMNVNIDSLILSFVGDYSRLPFAPKLPPDRFLMFSTPIDPKVANLVTSSYLSQHGITFGYNQPHWIGNAFSRIHKLWVGTL